MVLKILYFFFRELLLSQPPHPACLQLSFGSR